MPEDNLFEHYAEQVAMPGEMVEIEIDGVTCVITAEELAKLNQQLYEAQMKSWEAAGVAEPVELDYQFRKVSVE